MHSFQGATAIVLSHGRRVTVYSGKDDYICNYLGGKEWANSTQWSGQVRERGKREERLRMVAIGYVHVCACVHVCVNVYVRTCMCAYMHAHVCVEGMGHICCMYM